MRPTIADGRSIDQFIPSHLREMFYHNPIPQYKYATHDGYDPYGFSTENLVLYLPPFALRDTSFKSIDAYKHSCVKTLPVSRPDHWLFDGTDDEVTLGSNAVLNMGTSDFTFLVWVYPTALSGGANTNLMAGAANASAGLLIDNTGSVMRFEKYGAVAVDSTLAWSLDAWQLLAVGFDNSEATNNVFFNLDGSVETKSLNVDFTSASNKLGEHPTEADRSFIGRMGEVWIYKGRFLPAAEIADIRARTAWRYS